MEEQINKLFQEIENYCKNLAISNDSPDIKDIKEWFEKYEKIKLY